MFFDFKDGDFCKSLSDSLGIDSKGDLMLRMSDNAAIDLKSGDLHLISSWDKDEKDKNKD